MEEYSERTKRCAEHLSRMIRCETVSVEENPSLEKFAKFYTLLKELFPSIFQAAEATVIGGSLVLRWRGTDPSKLPVLFMNHSDTVEAQGEWKHPPFSGEIAEGKVWGRGTLDTKGGLWGMLEAADELAAEGFVPDCDIWFESSCCEEVTIPGYGAKNVAEVFAERGLHFSMILDEGGMMLFEPIGGAKGTFAMVGVGERGCASLRFTARGNGGHGSTPERNTPLVRLGKFMADADANRMFEVQIAPAIQELFRRLAPTVQGPLKFVYGHPEWFGFLLKKVMPSVSATSRALVQSTIAFTMAEGSEGMNVIPAEASVVGNMRVSHHQGFQGSLDAITRVAEKYDLEVTVIEQPDESRLSDYNGNAFRLIERAVGETFPGVIPAPYIMTGCSDARYMDQLGDSCFRFVPFLINAEQMESIHGLNECVDVSTLEQAVDFYRILMKGAGNV